MDSMRSGHQEIAARVETGRRNLTRELTTAGLLRLAAILTLGFGLGIALHLLFRLGTWGSWGTTAALLVSVIYAAVLHLARPLASRPGRDRFVEWLDARYDREKNIIVSAYQLGRDESAGQRFAPEFVTAVVDKGAEAARKVKLDDWRHGGRDRRWWIGLASALGLFALLFAVAGPGRVVGAAGKVVDPRRAAAPPIVIAVEPGDLTVERGENVQLAVQVSGSGETPVLRVREAGGIWMSRRLTEPSPDPKNPAALHYTGLLRSVERNQEYQVQVHKTESPVWHVTVNEPPRVSGFEITYFYPDYTGREPETLTSGSGDISALVGTKVRLKVLTNRRTDQAWMLTGPAGMELSEPTRLEALEDTNWETRFSMAGAPREFSIALRDGAGVDKFTSPRFRIEPVPDRPPIVRLLLPDRDIPIPEEMNLTLEADGLDDFGLTRLDLVYSVKDGAEGRIRLKEFPGGTAEIHGQYPWDLVPLNLFPGNEVTYYLELFDNDRVSGPKAARSEVRHLRFPTMDEMYTEVQEEHEKQIDDLSSVLGGSQELKKALEQLSRDAKKGDDMSWDKKKEIENLLDRQAELEKQLSETAKELDETLNKAQEQTLISPELLQKMQELSELMHSIKNEKLKESFQKLSDALKNMDKEAMDKALEEFKLNQQEMVQSIDKTIELLKEIRKEEMMEDAVRKAEEMAKQQEDLSRQMDKEGKNTSPENPDPSAQKKNQELAGKQSDVQKKAEELQKQIEDLKKLAENEPKLQENLEQMDQSQEQQEMKKNMEQSGSEMGKGQKEKALRFAFKARDQARNMANQMKKAQEESNAAKRRELQEKLMAVIQDLVDVSSAQEELLAQAPQTQETELAQRQRVLMDGTLKAALELEALGKRTLFVNKDQQSKIGNAMKRMDTATRSFVQGNRNTGLKEGKESAGDLNEAIVELMQSHSSMCQSGSPTGFMESMQKMAGLTQQQQDLNTQTQGMAGGQGQQPRLSESQSEQLERMAAQQEMIRRGLEDVAGKLKNRKDVLGRLDNLAKEMGDVAQELRKNNVDERLLERQERILSRLLDAQKSIRKKDDQNERESKTAEQLVRPSPAPLSREQLLGPERLRSDILRGQSDNYPAQYRALVEKYFRALSEQRARDKTSNDKLSNDSGKPAE